MFRVLAGGIAVLAGVVVALIELWLWLGGPDQQNAAGWTLIFSLFWLPYVLTYLPLGLLVLEYLAKFAPGARTGVLMGGPILIPLAIALLSSMSNLPAVFAHPEGAPMGATTLVIAAGFIVPSLVMCVLYAFITAFDPSNLRKTGESAIPAQAVAPPRPALVNINLNFPTTPAAEELDSHRIMELLTSPDHRIGQQHFLVVIGVLGLASQIWFPLPFLLGGILHLEQDVRIALALFGWLVLFWGAFCAIANRLHDLGLSAVWATTPMLAALAWLLIEGEPRLGWTPQTALFHWVIATAICFAIAAAILLLRKGEPWSNQYGPEQV